MNNIVQIGPLPTWDLTDLYPGTTSSELTADLKTSLQEAQKFKERNKGCLAMLDGRSLGHVILEYECQQERLGRLMSYAYLNYAKNVSDPESGRFLQNIEEKIIEVKKLLLFFEHEIRWIDDSDLTEKQEDSQLSNYMPWLRDVRAFRPYQLSDEVEKFLIEKSLTGRSSWVRLFDQIVADLRFPFKGQELTETEVLGYLSDPNSANRREAAQSLGKVLGENIQPFALITNTLIKDKQIEDGWRGFNRPISSRNLSNFVDDKVVDTLLTTVSEGFPTISHRYYLLKAKWHKLDKLNYWDKNAPAPNEEARIIPWSEAQKTVIRAYRNFSKILSDIGERFFKNDWIDAVVRPGKSSGAFAHPSVPSVHPYLLLNYQGKTRDVMTLAHELGHGIHQVLSAGQGYLMADTPLTLAETASVFGEMLTFQEMLETTDDRLVRQVMLADKIEDMINTVVRQTAFCLFEQNVHEARRSGELTADEISDIWMKTQIDSLGPAFQFHNEYRYFWAYIPHFIHTPFYVYSYVFGDCLVNALFSLYQIGKTGFVDKYLEMLRAGGTLRYQELLSLFDLDATDPGFWNQGLKVTERLIDELEETI